MDHKFYVYCYSRPDCGTPIYIGKGCGDRDVWHLRNLDRVEPFYFELRAMQDERLKPVVRRLVERLTEAEAIFWEKFFIAALGRTLDNSGPLLNQNLGGLGTAGFKFSLESRLKKSRSQVGRSKSLRQRFNLMRARRKQYSGRGVSRSVDRHGTMRWDVHYGGIKIGSRPLYCEALLLRRIVEEADNETFAQWVERTSKKPVKKRPSKLTKELSLQATPRTSTLTQATSFSPLNYVQSEEAKQRMLAGTASTPEDEEDRRRRISEGCKTRWQDPDYRAKMVARRKRGKGRKSCGHFPEPADPGST